ncbi:siderophore-interacting protein [Mycolicibacterium brumae]|uniref:Siderophore-interacting protein n=1 Tax=Mycolicibacterium brumae TaxID=85968 RepID=A0A2G5PAL6_9MYCO|nr:siderophore-interacting protein [Mycolicibacterium brumae]MCV7192134.1 siderophore-interacting protein [Mycolicibacterium brumae]PIB75409.1 siderophore-interacting protein [Mycolicibacterium brumae]RWA20799.1 hypothetical protein MBRU_03810 [Mycolicibacterium brumae DSM 44177]UWW07897.1 siderophore-interacting protein [Mycolicibacterium brumae]
MADTSRGLTGTLVKLFGGADYQLTVTGRTELTPHYLRLHFDAGTLLADRPVHPTMWVRGWFPDGAKAHQRGYTLVNPDPAAGTVDIDFALHDGLATRWAENAQPGDILGVTVLGSNFTLPTPDPAGYLIVGDPASLPAINSLLDAIGPIPAWVFLEAAHDDDKQLPVNITGDSELFWVDRTGGGQGLIDTVRESAFDAADHFAWVACDNRTTRTVAKVLREQYGVPKGQLKAQGYWAA